MTWLGCVRVVVVFQVTWGPHAVEGCCPFQFVRPMPRYHCTSPHLRRLPPCVQPAGGGCTWTAPTVGLACSRPVFGHCTMACSTQTGGAAPLAAMLPFLPYALVSLNKQGIPKCKMRLGRGGGGNIASMPSSYPVLGPSAAAWVLKFCGLCPLNLRAASRWTHTSGSSPGLMPVHCCTCITHTLPACTSVTAVPPDPSSCRGV